MGSSRHGSWGAGFQLAGGLGLPGRNQACGQLHRSNRCLVEQSGWFGKAPVVVAGDLDSNSQWDANRPGRNHTEVVRLFESHDLISAYHAHNRENQGAETRPTYYFYRHQDKPFHIDYVFFSKGWKLKSVEVGSFREWGNLSDHVPVVVDVSTGGDE
jgi:endonuclease/exonuclease/phosphatase family metal-dependent hydrolase